MYILLFVLTILLIALTIYLTHRWKQGLDEEHPEIGLSNPGNAPAPYDFIDKDHPNTFSI